MSRTSVAATNYGQLLARGQVVHRLKDVQDIETWRAEIRRQARADKIKIRTGFNDGIVWAIRAQADRPEWHAEVRRYRDLLLRAVPLAVELRHKPTLAARDGDELVCTCRRCSALGYGNAAEDIVGGVVFEDDCRNVEPPRLTAMAMMHVPGSRWASDGPGRA